MSDPNRPPVTPDLTPDVGGADMNRPGFPVDPRILDRCCGDGGGICCGEGCPCGGLGGRVSAQFQKLGNLDPRILADLQQRAGAQGIVVWGGIARHESRTHGTIYKPIVWLGLEGQTPPRI
jgi:hypothetical protein